VKVGTTWTGAHGPPRKHGGRRIWPVALLVLVLIAGVGWAAYLGSSFGGGGGGSDAASTDSTGSTATTTQNSTTATTAAATTTVAGLTTASYDPSGSGGDGDEHPEETANAIDGDPGTVWHTDTYRASDVFGGIKPGVGLILTAPKAVTATALRLQGGLEGWTGRVYSAPGTTPPADIAGWSPVSKQFSARTVPMTVPLTGGPGRLYLIWITKLAPVDTGFAASIAEASLATSAEN
jgi:putative peptidoglycan lipid II flippase